MIIVAAIVRLTAQSFQPTDAGGNSIAAVTKAKLDKSNIVPGQLIVKFKEGVLDTQVFEEDQLAFEMVTLETLNGWL